MLDEEERKNRGRERTIKQKKENFFVTLPVKKEAGRRRLCGD